jgi:hypothetical protein
MRDDNDYLDDMPCGFGLGGDQNLPLFDKLLILKIFKPEKLMFAF